MSTRARPLILIADDDWMSREVLQSFLESAGYRVIAASNGSDALNLARERQPMLAVVDVRMNDLSGYEVCKTIKQDGATGAMKVMLITALLREQERNSAAKAGADDVISKSFDWNVILAHVCKLLPPGA
jgi:CheY-like chemotaxis protein